MHYQFQPRLGIAYRLSHKMVIRAGAGRFLTQTGLYDNIFPGANSPFQPFVTVSNVSIDNPGASLTTGETPPLTVTTKSRYYKPPEAWTWNFTFQREVFWNSVVQIGYVGRRGLHLPQVSDFNQPAGGALLTNPGVNVNALRPYAGFASILMLHYDVNSLYNGLQLSWNKRFRSGVSFGFSYTFAKSRKRRMVPAVNSKL